MNYFVNENIFTLNSGTEFSAVKRVKLFQEHHIGAKIITRNYNPQLSTDIERVGLNSADVLGMYDYFQELQNIERVDVDVRYAEAIDKNNYHIEGIDSNESLIKHEGRTIGKVLITPGTVGLIGAIEHYNDMNQLVAKDIWDRRGFKSSTQYYHPNGTEGPQIFFDKDGKAKIEIIHMNINGQLFPTMYKLLDYKGKVWRFNTEQDLFTFFMNELAAESPSVFFNDRPSLIPAVAGIQNAVGKWHVLHNIHSENNRQVGASRQISPYLNELFTVFKDSFDGLVVATEQQKEEIATFFNFRTIMVLPDATAENIMFNPITNRDRNKIVYLGRMASEKNPVDAVEILARARQKIPTLRLEFFGYASPNEVQEELNKAVEVRNLNGAVIFRGYNTPAVLNQELQTASLLINTSEGEGFAMNILEGMSHGIPTVAYDVKYGPSILIDKNKSGHLVPFASLQGAADAIVDILQTDESWSSYAQAAYDKAQLYSSDNVWRIWLENKAVANNLFVIE